MSSTKQFGFHTVLIPIMVVLVELILHVATWVSPHVVLPRNQATFTSCCDRYSFGLR